MNENETGVNEQEIAEPAKTGAETESAAPEGAQGAPEAPEEKPAQSREENSAFAAMRRRTEAAEKRAAELEKAGAGADTLRRAMQTEFGLSGTDEELADQLIAIRRNSTPEAVRAEREAAQKRAREQMKSDPEFVALQSERDYYRSLEIQNAMAKDLAAIKAAHPECTLTNLEELGEDYAHLIAGGWDAVDAYEALQGRQNKAAKTAPPSTGSVSSPEAAKDKDYYTPEEVDKLTDEDFRRDPLLLDKVEKSMTRWR